MKIGDRIVIKYFDTDYYITNIDKNGNITAWNYLSILYNIKKAILLK